MRIAIVGNGSTDRDRSAEIDSADEVVRFNHCQSLQSGLLGKRTDVLALQSMDGIAQMDGWPDVGQRHKCLVIFSVVQSVMYRLIEDADSLIKVWTLDSRGFSPTGRRLSTGSIIVEYYQGYADTLELYGFDWRGWSGHDWEAERKLYGHLCKS